MVAAFVSNAQAPGEFCHLGLGERFALLHSLFHSVQDKVLEKFDVVRIDNLLVDLDRDDVARAVCRHFHFAVSERAAGLEGRSSSTLSFTLRSLPVISCSSVSRNLRLAWVPRNSIVALSSGEKPS